MKRTCTLLILIGAVYFGATHSSIELIQSAHADAKTDILSDAFNTKTSGIQAKGEGTVTKVLSDDTEGSKHQRFILKLPSGQTILIAHNIDLAPRVKSLKVGDTISFYGVYEWNSKGGTVHWTRHDPKRRHVGGWLKNGSITYR
jgi:hypothetical protein